MTDVGIDALRVGALLTPALVLVATQAGGAAIMVTGSHIPADRNGLKFYVPAGEISKADEAAILTHLGQGVPVAAPGQLRPHERAAQAYVQRYVMGFGPAALSGMRVGVYAHSSVARDILVDVVRALGADTISLARSDVFIPVDTEAVAPETRAAFAAWVQDHTLDALVSTDGDGGRPMVTDTHGTVVPGDVLGTLTARLLGARVLVTPVSSNSMIDSMAEFEDIRRTRIGSPYVIAEMENTLAQQPDTCVAGYEANGGFLLGWTAAGPAGPLPPLMTRDSVLPILAPLVAARRAVQSLADLVRALPARHTASDRVQGIDPPVSGPFLEALRNDPARRARFFDTMPPDVTCNVTDSLRVTFEGGE